MLLIEQLHQHKPKGDLGASTGPLHRRRAMTLPRASPLSTAPPGPRHAAPPELRRLHTPHIHRAAPPAPTGCSNRKKKKVVSAARSMGIWERKKKYGSHTGEKGGSGSRACTKTDKNVGPYHSFTCSKNIVV
jgi:hypothetical protein